MSVAIPCWAEARLVGAFLFERQTPTVLTSSQVPLFFMAEMFQSLNVLKVLLRSSLFVMVSVFLSVIGTSSLRRIAQLRRRFPHLVFESVVSFSLLC